MKKIYSLVLLVAGVFSWGSCSLDEVNPTTRVSSPMVLIHWKLIRHSPTRAIQP